MYEVARLGQPIFWRTTELLNRRTSVLGIPFVSHNIHRCAPGPYEIVVRQVKHTCFSKDKCLDEVWKS